MLFFPEVQNKAHLALVKAIGRDRLPETNEIESTPYIHAVMREVLRWHPIGPLGRSISDGVAIRSLVDTLRQVSLIAQVRTMNTGGTIFRKAVLFYLMSG